MTLNQLNQLIEEGNSLKLVAQAYAEIANQKIKKIRFDVERNRLFFKEIYYLYGLIRNLAAGKKLLVAKPKNRICLLLTSNHRFYGSINSDLINFFISSTKSIKSDKLILGKVAIDHFNTLNYPSFLLKDDRPSSLELNQLINIIKDYNEVLIFYSSLKTLLVQQPAVTNITAQTLTSPLKKGSALHNPQVLPNFIFEPDLPKILSFFDSSILTLLLNQTFLESEVARTASRFISMDQAETEANNLISQYQKQRLHLLKSIGNIQILENFARAWAVKKGGHQ